MLQRLAGLFEVADRERRVEPGAAINVEQRLEVHALDPVHRDDVPFIHEEVLADQREPRMGRKREKQPRLGEQMGAGSLVGHGPDLQRHLAIVEVIERPDHLALSTPPHHFERLLPPPPPPPPPPRARPPPRAEELCPHRGSAVGRRSPSLTAPRATAAFASWTR